MFLLVCCICAASDWLGFGFWRWVAWCFVLCVLLWMFEFGCASQFWVGVVVEVVLWVFFAGLRVVFG